MEMWCPRDDISTILRCLELNEPVYRALLKIGVIIDEEWREKLYYLLYDIEQCKAAARDIKSKVETAFDTYLSVVSYSMGHK